MASQMLGRRFGWFWAASWASNLADGVALIVLPWIATGVADSALGVAAVAAAGRAPWLVAVVPAGALVDRVSRTAAMASASCARALLWGALGVLALTGGLSVPLLLGAAFALGLVEVVYDTAAVTAIPGLVRRDQLDTANGRFRIAEITAQELLGRPAGGLALALGAAAALFAPAALGLLAAALLLPLRGSEPSRRAVPGPPWSGFTAIARSPLLRHLVGAAVALNLAYAMATAIQVLFAQSVLGLSAPQFGLLMAAAAVGGIAGGHFSAALSSRLPPGWLPAAGLAAASAGYAATASFPTVAVTACALFCSSAGVLIFTVAASTLRQRAVPDHLLGRVNAAVGMATWGTGALGMLAGGALADAAGPWLTTAEALRLPYAAAAAVIALPLVLLGRPLARLSTQAQLGD